MAVCPAHLDLQRLRRQKSDTSSDSSSPQEQNRYATSNPSCLKTSSQALYLDPVSGTSTGPSSSMKIEDEANADGYLD